MVAISDHTHIPTAVERGDVKENRWRGVIFDDDGYGHVGRSQSAENTVRGQKKVLFTDTFKSFQSDG